MHKLRNVVSVEAHAQSERRSMKGKRREELKSNLKSTKDQYQIHVQKGTTQCPAALYLKQVIEDIRRQLGR